jgi:cytochrome c-type biogenesis protein CcmH/NrfG
MRRNAAVLTLALALLGAPLVVSRAAAQEAPAAAPRTTPYAEACAEGLGKLRSGDTEGAVAALRRAVQLEQGRPLGFYYLGEALRVQRSHADALEMFRTASRLARAAGDTRLEARSLQGVADTLERIDGKRNEARAAWAEYLVFANANAEVASPALAHARIQALDTVRELDETYADVRERIAIRARETARPNP